MHPTRTNKASQLALNLLLATGIALGTAACTHNRSMGTVLDDQTMEVRVIDAIYSAPDIDRESHIKVEAHNRTVLLTGETDTASKREQAGRLAKAVYNVERVVNEIEVSERANTGTRANNSWLTAKVNTTLVANKDLPGFDLDRVKVVTSNGTVYLMGELSHADADAITEVVRNIGGVDKVVKIFDYTD